MVDFQSRDTRRGPTTDEEPESDEDSSTDVAEPTESETDADEEPDATEPTESETDADKGADATADPLADQTDTADTADPLADQADPADRSDGTNVFRPGDHPDTQSDETEESGEASRGRSAVGTEPATPSRSVDVAVVTVSGDRASLEDTVTAAFESVGHTVVRRERLRGGYEGIQQMVDALVGRDGVDAVVTVGGVGVAADEMAIEAVHPLLEKALPGFGEAFRSLLSTHVGTGIVGVRTTAGVSDGTLVVCLPGEPEAVELAVTEILATEAPTLVAQLGE